MLNQQGARWTETSEIGPRYKNEPSVGLEWQHFDDVGRRGGFKKNEYDTSY